MTRSDGERIFRSALAATALGATCLLAGCGQASSSTSVVLTGPADKVEALVARHKLLEQPVQAHVEKLPDGRERAALNKPKGLPAGELIDLGKAAAKAGVSFEFSSGTQWSSGSSSTDVSGKITPAPKGGPVA